MLRPRISHVIHSNTVNPLNPASHNIWNMENAAGGIYPGGNEGVAGGVYMLIIDIPHDTLATFRPPTFPQLPLRSQLLLRLLMLQMLYIALQLLHFLFKCIKLCSCQGAIEFFCGALAVFVARTTFEGEGFEEDSCGDKGGERAQHGHGGWCKAIRCKVLGGFRTWTLKSSRVRRLWPRTLAVRPHSDWPSLAEPCKRKFSWFHRSNIIPYLIHFELYIDCLDWRINWKLEFIIW